MPTDETNQINVDGGKVHLISDKSLNKLLKAMRMYRPKQGKGTTLNETEEGTYIDGGGGEVTVTTADASGYIAGSGVGSVQNVNTLTFDQDLFEIFDGGGGQCVVKLKTCPATCS